MKNIVHDTEDQWDKKFLSIKSFIDKINKIDYLLDSLIKKKNRDNIQSTGIRNKSGNIPSDTTDIKRWAKKEKKSKKKSGKKCMPTHLIT